MKHKLFLWAILMMAMAIPQSVMAYNFSVTVSSGQTLCFNYGGSGTVVLTYQHQPAEDNGYTAYDNLTGDLVIPSEITYEDDTYTVTMIGSQAFANCSGLTSVTIPNTVTSVGNRAFESCISLDSIIIPSSISYLPVCVFARCTGLTYADVGEGVTQIGMGAFEFCTNLQTIVLHSALSRIDVGAFNNCNGLTKVNYTGPIENWCNIDFYGFSPTYNSNNLYLNNELLTHLVIPEGVTYISRYAFIHCMSLTSITLPNTLDSIGEGAFFGIGHLTIYYNGNVSQWCNIKHKEIAPYYSWRLYVNNQLLTHLTIPGNLTTLRPYAFQGCSSLTSVSTGNTLNKIGKRAFEGCHNVTSLFFGDDLTTIDTGAFSGCSKLDSLIVGNNISIIDSGAFSNCFRIKSLILGSSISTIGDDAFSNCSNLSSIHILRYTPPLLGSNAFGYISEDAHLWVPCENGSAYRAAPGWRDFAHIRDEGMYNVSLSVRGYDRASMSTVTFDQEPTCSNPNYAVIRAVPASGCHFYGWTDGNHDNPRTVDIVSDTSFTAFFIENQIGWVPVTSCDSVTTPYRADLSTCWQAIGNTTISSNTAILHGVGDTLRSPWISLANNGGTFLFFSGVPESHDYRSMTILIRTQDGESGMFVEDLVGDNLLYTFKFPQLYCGSGRKIQMDFVYDEIFGDSEITLSNIGVSQFQADLTIHGPDTVRVGDTATYYATIVASDNSVSPQYNWYCWVPNSEAMHSDSSTFSCTWQYTGLYAINCSVFYGQYYDGGFKNVVVIQSEDVSVVTDSIFVHDTIFFPVHDTTFINIHDTTYINIFVHDTTTVIDTLTLIEYVPAHDTTYITQTVFDTITNTVHDTTVVFSTDTLWLYDTVFVNDTVYIHDTIVVGVDEVDAISAKIYTSNGQIVVESGDEGGDLPEVTLYDAVGRIVEQKAEHAERRTFEVPSSGVYLVKIGERPARRVVVIR